MRCPGRAAATAARYDIALTYARARRAQRCDRRGPGACAASCAARARVLMVRPTPEFFLLMFALFKAGAVPVLVDPGIDKRALKQCLDEAQPEAFIGIPLAHVARVLLGWARSARMRITTGARALAAPMRRWREVERDGADAGPQLADTQPDDVAAILFTSGSTGVPKGVVYRHRHFVAQVEMLREAFGIAARRRRPADVPAVRAVRSGAGHDVDHSRHGSDAPGAAPIRASCCDAIERFGVTQLFGSPALMAVLARHGAPLPTRASASLPPARRCRPDVVARMRALLPDDAQFWTPYGATECLPVA